ncbi:amidohydrolase family protein, partial [Serratia ureilytica]|uniref:amidohydrolase family protein n=1 Tax=Serratia ureilytica TaxID=300181 RepID=UPI001E428336
RGAGRRRGAPRRSTGAAGGWWGAEGGCPRRWGAPRGGCPARHDQHWLVLDHLGKPDIARGARHWAQQIRPLAALPHVACKLSGLITEAPGGRWRAEELLPFFDAALEAFGPQRLMFGSDWPVCLLAGDYRQVVQLCERALATLGAAEQAAIWGDTAWRIYGLTESGYGSVSAR